MLGLKLNHVSKRGHSRCWVFWICDIVIWFYYHCNRHNHLLYLHTPKTRNGKMSSSCLQPCSSFTGMTNATVTKNTVNFIDRFAFSDRNLPGWLHKYLSKIITSGTVKFKIYRCIKLSWATSISMPQDLTYELTKIVYSFILISSLNFLMSSHLPNGLFFYHCDKCKLQTGTGIINILNSWHMM